MDKGESSSQAGNENEMDISSSKLLDTVDSDSSQESKVDAGSVGISSVACQTEESTEAMLKRHAEMEALKKFNDRLEIDNENLREMIRKRKEKTAKLREEIEAYKTLSQSVVNPEEGTEVDSEKLVEGLDRLTRKRKK